MDNLKEFLNEIQEKKNNALATNELNRQLINRKNILDLKILVVLDVSGSISMDDFSNFMVQLNKLRGISIVKVVEVDTEVVAFYDYFKTNQSAVARLMGGGFTRLGAGINLANEIKAEAILVMTDGFVQDKEEVLDPKIPVGYVLTADGAKPYEFGNVIKKLPRTSSRKKEDDDYVKVEDGENLGDFEKELEDELIQ